MSQRYVSAPPWPGEKDTISQLFDKFYDRKGPRDAVRHEWAKMSAEDRQALRAQMEKLHERMMENFRSMPSQMMLLFRYSNYRHDVSIL